MEVVAGNWFRIACAVRRAGPAVSGTASNRAAKSAMLISSSEPGGLMVLFAAKCTGSGAGETYKLQKRRASSKLSGTLSDAWTRVNRTRHPVLLSIQTSDKRQTWTSKREVWAT